MAAAATAAAAIEAACLLVFGGGPFPASKHRNGNGAAESWLAAPAASLLADNAGTRCDVSRWAVPAPAPVSEIPRSLPHVYTHAHAAHSLTHSPIHSLIHTHARTHERAHTHLV